MTEKDKAETGHAGHEQLLWQLLKYMHNTAWYMCLNAHVTW